MTFFIVCVLMLLSSFVKAIEQSIFANKKMGWQLGESVRDLDATIGAEASSGNANAMLSSLREQIGDNNNELVNPKVQEAIAHANDLVMASVEKDYICDRDWEQACPDGWFVIGDACQAPSNYEGACMHLASSGKLPVEQKKAFANDCQAPWPCVGSCPGGHNYDESLCPNGWSEVGGGLCNQDDEKANRCGNTFYFAGMNIVEKQALTKICFLEWPCMATCARNYNSACPELWEQSANGLCIAPATYAGDCSHGVDLSRFKFQQKQNFANKCNVRFPCVGSIHGSMGDAIPLQIRGREENGPVDMGTGNVISQGMQKSIQTNLDGLEVGTEFPVPDDVMPSGPVSATGQIIF